MKNYIVINGKELHIIKKQTEREAVTWAQNYCDHSSEIIVRECNNYFTTNQA